jgi:hypothetical protein
MRSQKMKEAAEAGKMLLFGAGGAVLSSWLLNMTPGVKTANPTTKSLAQLGVGMVAVLFGPKARAIRYAGMGIAFAGTLGAVERMTSMKTLAGPPVGTLSPSEIRALQSMGAMPMNGPVVMRRMNGPTTMRNMGMQPSMMGGFKVPR